MALVKSKFMENNMASEFKDLGIFLVGAYVIKKDKESKPSKK